MRHYWYLIPLLILMLTACGGDEPPAAAQSQNPTPVPVENDSNPTPVPEIEVNAQAALPEGAIAIVNDAIITQSDYDRLLAQRSANTNAADDAALRAQILDTLIEQELIRQAASEMGVNISAADIDAEMESLQAAVGESDVESWESWLESNGYTDAEMRAELENSLITRRVIDAIAAQLEGDVAQVRARHILVETEDAAIAALQRLQNGEDFAELAAELSVDMMSRDLGGELGWFIREELTDPQLADVAFSLDEGAIAGPVQSSIGYHIIQTLEKAEQPIEAERRPLLLQTLFEQWLIEQYENASIQRATPG